MATILVTGAAGFIGSHTVDALLAAGHSVVGVDNFRTGRRDNLVCAESNPSFQLEVADVAEPGTLDGIVAALRPNCIIHLAALVSVPESIEKPAENFRLNVAATELVAEAAVRHKVRRIVFASSAAVYASDSAEPIDEDAPCEPRSPYGAAKLASENLLLGWARTSGIEVRCQRYFNVYGPRQDPSSPYSGVISLFTQAALAGQPVRIHGDGNQSRDFIFVEDVARANVLAACRDAPTGTANICCGRRTTLNELVAALGGATGRPISSAHGPIREGDIRHSCGCPGRARQEIGFQAIVTLSDGLTRYLATAKVASVT